jgi:NAD(P)-dependent dehydrogenase (short-subunit alcohol dehydrogenase family)
MSDSRAVLVTGAGGGMGIACARALAGEGTLLLQEIDAARLSVACDTLAGEGIEARMVAGDLLDPSHLSTLSAEVEKVGGLRALVHTAGLSPTMAEARRVFDVDLVATARLVDALIPQLGPGSVAVLLASQAGHMVAGAATPEIDAILDAPLAADAHEQLVELAGPLAGEPGGAYGLAKRGVQRLAVHRAKEFGAAGARIVSVSPGIIDTSMGHAERGGQPDATDVILAKTPVGNRMGRPEEVAAVVAFLCSESAAYVSGVDWLVDGGSTLQVLGPR